MVRMKVSTLACYAFCLAAGAFLGRYELHTDDTGVEVFFILLATFVLGCWHPRRAWQWALLVGPCAPAADWIFKAGQTGLLGITAAVIAFGLVGTYAGVFFRKGIAVSAGHAG
jgi:hypothetical protein